mgnify:CR=1 FL=1
MSGIVGKNLGRGSGVVTATPVVADAISGANIADDAIDSEHYTDGSIDNAHIADDAIDSEHYADGSIDEGHIADNAVTLAKMAGGTDGNIISYDTSGDPVAIATGNDGQVLTSSGANTQPAFEDAAGGGGIVVQQVSVTVTALVSGSTILPYDDTIPQKTEGNEMMTLAITPTNSSNKLKIDVVTYSAVNIIAGIHTCAIFQDTTAGALAAAVHGQSGDNHPANFKFTHHMIADTTSATTFKVRVGGNTSGSLQINGTSGARRMGGVMASSITITEYAV